MFFKYLREEKGIKQALLRHYGPAVLYCTALFCTVLYKKRRMKEEKIRKFADKQTSKEQSNGSKTEATLILCGYSGERANIIVK